MYKVFVNNKPVILTNAVSFETFEKTDYVMDRSNISDLRTFIKDYESDFITKRLFVVDDDVKMLWQEFNNLYRQIFAAGGVVKNQNNQLLYIYRSGKWDLPKGKVEKDEDIGETAIREVEEECGVKNLTIIKELPTTYHTYEDKIGDVLKTTFWYEMYTEDISELIPQAEEGIEKACWLDDSHLKDIYSNTFASIRELLETYKKTNN